MSEIDLVPTDYRQSLRLRSWLRAFATAQLCMLVCLVAAKVALEYGVRTKGREVAALQVAEETARQQQMRLGQLRQEQEVAQRRLSILAGLRGGISSSDEMFLAVDAALSEDIWFLGWNFRRAGELVEHDPKAVQTGYFIVVPMEQPNQPQQAWRLDTHMEIRGQALDHSTLAQFVSRLLDQPLIEQVRVVSTRVRGYTAAEVVDFELAVVVRTEA
jgi:hypothetical protein